MQPMLTKSARVCCTSGYACRLKPAVMNFLFIFMFVCFVFVFVFVLAEENVWANFSHAFSSAKKASKQANIQTKSFMGAGLSPVHTCWPRIPWKLSTSECTNQLRFVDAVKPAFRCLKPVHLTFCLCLLPLVLRTTSRLRRLI